MERIKNPFPYSDSNKRYHTYDYALRRRFGQKVGRVSLSGGFTCPNRDGTKGTGGCCFCSAAGSGEFSPTAGLSITDQFSVGRKMVEKKWGNVPLIAYFQSFTGTYAPVSYLHGLYEAALAQPGVVGLSIATRTDCLGEEVLGLLEELSGRTCLQVELGLQSIHDETTRRMNCQHSLKDFMCAYHHLQERGITACVHLIDGLPGETAEMMHESAQLLAELEVPAVKIHLLYAVAGTVVGEAYRRGEIRLLEREEYIHILCDQLECLPARTVIQRLTGDGDKRTLLGPAWSRDKRRVLGEIDLELVRRDSWQGKRFSTAGSGEK